MMRPASEKDLPVGSATRCAVANNPCAIFSLAPAPVTACSLWGQLDATKSSFPESSWVGLSAFALRAQNVTMAAHRVNELHGIIAVDLAPEPGNVNFNHVAEFLP